MNDFNSEIISNIIEIEGNTLIELVKSATINSDPIILELIEREKISSARLVKLFFNCVEDPLSNKFKFESKILTMNNMLSWLKNFQIVSWIVSVSILLFWSFYSIFDSFLFGCTLGIFFLVYYNHLFKGDPVDLSLQQTTKFFLINIGMVMISCLLVIASIIWSSFNDLNYILAILQILVTILLYFNITISVCRMNDRIIT